MHMADALVAPAVAVGMYGLSSLAAANSIKHVKNENDPKKIPTMGVMGAFVFATQMVNFTIPGTGSSGHLCGGVLLTAMLGPYAGFLSMIGVLLIQCLLFADGGILALGCNIWNMAFYGCFFGGLVIWKNVMKKGITKKKIVLGSILACVISLQLGAFSVTIETLLSGITELPFGVFIAAMQPIHLAIGLVEGIITAAVLVFVHEARPELLYDGNEREEKEKLEGRFTYKKTIIVLLLTTFIIAGGVSLLASSKPDGLEWSMEKVAGTAELENDGSIYEVANSIQEKTSKLSDYDIDGQGSLVGTTVSGLVGSFITIMLCILSCYGFKFFRKKEQNE